MFVFTGHRGPGGCRRSKNKSSTDFWSFVWRISPQHFWHISTFACFCFTELATQQMLFLSVYGSSAENKSLSFFSDWSLIEADFFGNHSFGWGDISAYSDFSFSMETLGRFPEKWNFLEFSIFNFKSCSILTSKLPIPNSQLSMDILRFWLSNLNSCFSNLNSEFCVRIPDWDAWLLSWKANCQVSLDQSKGNLTTGFRHDVAITDISSSSCKNYLNTENLIYELLKKTSQDNYHYQHLQIEIVNIITFRHGRLVQIGVDNGVVLLLSSLALILLLILALLQLRHHHGHSHARHGEGGDDDGDDAVVNGAMEVQL